ncbi:MAG: hypothetical protein ACREEE_07220 [Dongiaceae bacterium]
MNSFPLAYIGFIRLDMPRARRDEVRTEARRGKVIGRLVAALRQRRWQRPPPIAHLSDHIRRDIGLPPAGQGGTWFWHR